MNVNENYWGAVLRDIRELLEVSLRDGADLLGVTAVALGRIERGKEPLNAVQFASMAAELLAPYRSSKHAEAAAKWDVIRAQGGP